MLNVPRMTRVERRLLVKLGGKTGDAATALLNPEIGRDWMLSGHQRRVVTPGNARQYLNGCLWRRAVQAPGLKIAARDGVQTARSGDRSSLSPPRCSAVAVLGG